MTKVDGLQRNLFPIHSRNNIPNRGGFEGVRFVWFVCLSRVSGSPRCFRDFSSAFRISVKTRADYTIGPRAPSPKSTFDPCFDRALRDSSELAKHARASTTRTTPPSTACHPPSPKRSPRTTTLLFPPPS